MAAGQPLRGFVGQKMGGKKAGSQSQVLSTLDAVTGSGTLTATTGCWAFIYLYGAGASGGVNDGGGGQGGGGGGGGALFKRVRLSGGQSLAWSCGAGGTSVSTTDGVDGGDTTVTLPTGVVLTAGGGKKGLMASTGGAGGIATNGDVNRTGGAGGSGNNAPGSAGPFGGAAGAAPSIYPGGGGAAGFSDVGTPLALGAGGAGASSGGAVGTAGAVYGGGGGSSTTGLPTGAGAAGHVIIWLVRQS